jgi:hypothetical protein
VVAAGPIKFPGATDMELEQCALCWKTKQDQSDDAEWHAIPNNVAVYVCDSCWKRCAAAQSTMAELGEALRKVLSV